MKHIKYLTLIMSVLVSGFSLTSCMDDDWNDPTGDTAPYGNNDLKEENVITIKELKDRYKSNILTQYSYELISEDIKIKGVVTGSDNSGNIYSEVPVQDETGAIIIAVGQGGIYGYLPVGTEILISLKDLYIGNYGLQAEIGMPTQDKNGKTYVGRMSRMTWQKHFKITGTDKPVEPEVFADGATQSTTNWDLFEDSGKLGTIKNVTIRNVKPNSVYADPNVENPVSVSWYFNEFKGNSIMIYNSPYSDFAAKTLPKGKCNITGIVKRFKDSWEIIIRDEKDVVELD